MILAEGRKKMKEKPLEIATVAAETRSEEGTGLRKKNNPSEISLFST